MKAVYLSLAMSLAMMASLLAFKGLAVEGSDNDEPSWSLLRRSVHPWERYVRGFRREHHFALSVGSVRGAWRVQNFGTIGASTSYAERGFYGKVQYSFHLPIAGSVGYFLGSSVGYDMASSRGQDFSAPIALHLPGFLIGLVWNVTPSWRLLGGLDHYLERIDPIEEHASSPTSRLSASLLTLADAMVMVDFFYSLNWGLRLEGHARRILYQKPKDATGKIENAGIAKADYWLGIGSVYHFL